MTSCAGCAGDVDPHAALPGIRSGSEVYHLACAPTALLDSASEEYRAIVRKGVRYFVEKFGEPPSGGDLGTRFLDLGRAVEAERVRRGSA
jgi:hypothetical protein